MSKEPNQFDKNKLHKNQQEEPMNGQTFNFLVFKLNVQSEEFEELKINEDEKVEHLLDSDEILLFVDNLNHRVWIWEGRNTSPKMKFISAELASIVRDQYAIDYNITTIDGGDEPIEFKILLGLELEV